MKSVHLALAALLAATPAFAQTVGSPTVRTITVQTGIVLPDLQTVTGLGAGANKLASGPALAAETVRAQAAEALATQNASATITGGTINGAPIGGTTPAAGAFTTLSATTPIAAASGGTGATTVAGGLNGVCATQGSLLYRSSSVWNCLAPSPSSGLVLTTGGPAADPSWSAVTTLAAQNANQVYAGPTSGSAAAPGFRSLTGADLPASVLRGGLGGLTLSNDMTTPASVLDTASGWAESDDATTAMALASAATKSLASTWAVGSGNGCLDTGTVTTGTYHIFLIERIDTGVVDELCSASATAPTMPASYTKARRIGTVLYASGTITPFKQLGDEFLLSTPVLDVNVSNQNTPAVLRALTVPTGIQVTAIHDLTAYNASQFSVMVSSPDTADVAPNGTSGFGSIFGLAGANNGAEFRTRTNTSGQIRTRSSVSATYLYNTTKGWTDGRGRLN